MPRLVRGIHFSLASYMASERKFFVYILANKPRGTLYIGMTNDIARRIYEHREGLQSGFTKTYGVSKLVYVEIFPTAMEAIRREKRLKKYPRAWKINLIHDVNPKWRDLYDTIN